jgi:hypothetical protein
VYTQRDVCEREKAGERHTRQTSHLAFLLFLFSLFDFDPFLIYSLIILVFL